MLSTPTLSLKGGQSFIKLLKKLLHSIITISTQIKKGFLISWNQFKISFKSFWYILAKKESVTRNFGSTIDGTIIIKYALNLYFDCKKGRAKFCFSCWVPKLALYASNNLFTTQNLFFFIVLGLFREPSL